jgi:hypothetical protein
VQRRINSFAAFLALLSFALAPLSFALSWVSWAGAFIGSASFERRGLPLPSAIAAVPIVGRFHSHRRGEVFFAELMVLSSSFESVSEGLPLKHDKAKSFLTDLVLVREDKLPGG